MKGDRDGCVGPARRWIVWCRHGEYLIMSTIMFFVCGAFLFEKASSWIVKGSACFSSFGKWVSWLSAVTSVLTIADWLV